MKVGEKGLNADINVTPLVDVMLVLLIIFMVITPMLQRGKPVPLPSVDNPEKQNDDGKDVIVSVEMVPGTGQGGQPFRSNVYIGKNKTDMASLKSKLEDELRREPGRGLFLKGDQRLDYGSIRQIMEVCHDAGFGQVRLATEEIKKKQ